MINGHVQALVNLQTISGTNPNRIHEFYETIITHIQSLETLGKLKEINGYVRTTLDKLPGITVVFVKFLSGCFFGHPQRQFSEFLCVRKDFGVSNGLILKKKGRKGRFQV